MTLGSYSPSVIMHFREWSSSLVGTGVRDFGRGMKLISITLWGYESIKGQVRGCYNC